MTTENGIISTDTLWTVDDVARFLRLSTSSVYKMAEKKKLPCLHIGTALRFDPTAVKDWATKGVGRQTDEVPHV